MTLTIHAPHPVHTMPKPAAHAVSPLDAVTAGGAR